MANAQDDDELETPVLRSLVWMGNTRRNIQAFPEGAQKIIGDELQLIQFGGMPKDAKPFKGVGSGVWRGRGGGGVERKGRGEGGGKGKGCASVGDVQR